MKVREVMTQEVISVRPRMRLKEFARLLAERGISGAPVVDEHGVVIGVISEGDVVAKQAPPAVHRRSLLDWVLASPLDADEVRRRGATTVEQAMTAPPTTIEPDRSVREAATLMTEHGVKRLPVVADGHLVGIVTRADLVRAYLRRDAEIMVSVRDGVLRDTMWLDANDFDIEVDEGIVRIGGRVDRRSTATIIEKLVGLVDGVAAVNSYLTWEFDDQRLEPSEGEREATTASLAARERPLPLHG